MLKPNIFKSPSFCDLTFFCFGTFYFLTSWEPDNKQEASCAVRSPGKASQPGGAPSTSLPWSAGAFTLGPEWASHARAERQRPWHEALPGDAGPGQHLAQVPQSRGSVTAPPDGRAPHPCHRCEHRPPLPPPPVPDPLGTSLLSPPAL